MDYKIIPKEEPLNPLVEEILNSRKKAKFAAYEESQREEVTEDEQKQEREPKGEVFHIKGFLSRINTDCRTLVNFSLEELSYLKSLVKPHISLGRNSGIGLKSRIFIALFSFATNQTYPEMQTSLGVKHSTISIIVAQCINNFFRTWAYNFIQCFRSPTYSPQTEVKFQNFPWCIGAVDTTTIAFLKPQSKAEQAASWDAKNHVNGLKLEVLVDPSGQASYANANFLAATHDKRIFDESGIIQFITQQGKSGTCNVLPVIADKGYQGIKQVSSGSVHMLKGSTPDNIKYNHAVAQDRQIVERWNCRFKMSWGMMHEKYRGDRRRLPAIVIGLTALTNYLIQLHPLNRDDDPSPDNGFEQSTSTCTQPINTDDSHSEPAVKYLGIRNQGSTCHLNCTLQFLFAIPEARKIISESAQHQLQPSLEIHKIFCSLLDVQSGIIPSTKDLTDLLGDKWLHERSIEESLFELIDLINENRSQYSSDNPFADLFGVKLPNNEIIKNIVYLPYNGSIINAMKRYITTQDEKLELSTLLPVLCARPPNTPNVKYPFSIDLDLSTISNTPGPYTLVCAVAYASHHLIYFKKVEDQWYILNDSTCRTCTEEQVLALQGGNEDECKVLWETLRGKWIAALLVYAKPQYRII